MSGKGFLVTHDIVASSGHRQRGQELPIRIMHRRSYCTDPDGDVLVRDAVATLPAASDIVQNRFARFERARREPLGVVLAKVLFRFLLAKRESYPPDATEVQRQATAWFKNENLDALTVQPPNAHCSMWTLHTEEHRQTCRVSQVSKKIIARKPRSGGGQGPVTQVEPFCAEGDSAVRLLAGKAVLNECAD